MITTKVDTRRVANTSVASQEILKMPEARIERPKQEPVQFPIYSRNSVWSCVLERELPKWIDSLRDSHDCGNGIEIEDVPVCEQFTNMKDAGRAFGFDISADELREADRNGILCWREERVWIETVNDITLPLDPRRIHGSDACGPVILVAVEDKVVIVNGNHRAYKILSHESNPNNRSLIGLAFADPAACEELLDLTLSKLSSGNWGFPTPKLVEGYRQPAKV